MYEIHMWTTFPTKVFEILLSHICESDLHARLYM